MPRGLTYLNGIKFGRLVVIGHSYTNDHGNSYWKCICDCGNIKIVQGNNLKSGSVRSCGCLVKEKTKSMITKRLEVDYIDGTALPMLTTNKYKNNKSGYKGVSWDRRIGKWRVSLCIKRNNIFLGYFDDIKDAVLARKEAEEKYYKPILTKYKVGESKNV